MKTLKDLKKYDVTIVDSKKRLMRADVIPITTLREAAIEWIKSFDEDMMIIWKDLYDSKNLDKASGLGTLWGLANGKRNIMIHFFNITEKDLEVK